MTYYIQIEDNQNNVVAVVKVEAETKQEARYKALRALYADANLYVISKEDAIKSVEENATYAIDEDGCEIDLKEED